MAAIGVLMATATSMSRLQPWSRGATENTVGLGPTALIDAQDLLARGLDPTLPRPRSSSMARRHSAKVYVSDEHLLVWPPPAMEGGQMPDGRAVTSSSACPCICMRASRRRSVRPGTRTRRKQGLSGSCATWSGVWSMRNRASRRREPILEAGWEEILTRHPPRPAARTPALARLHQHRRERATALHAPGHPQRQNAGGRHAERMALRWTAAGLLARPRKPSVAGKAYRQLPILRKCSPGTLEKGSGRQCH